MRERALVCLMDIRVLCYPMIKTDSLEDHWVINPYFEQLLYIFSDQYIRRQLAAMNFNFIVFGQPNELNLTQNTYSCLLSQKEKSTIYLQHLSKKLSYFINYFYDNLEKTVDGRYNRFYFQSPAFIILDVNNDNQWSSLRKQCRVNHYNQILLMSYDAFLLKKVSNDYGCATCYIYQADEWNKFDINNVIYYLTEMQKFFLTITISLCQSLQNSSQKQMLYRFFNRYFPDKKTFFLSDQCQDLSPLRNPQEIVVHFEKNAEQALSLWLQYASLTCHIVRVHEFREFDCQLSSIIANWVHAIQFSIPLNIGVTKSQPHITVSTVSTQTSRVKTVEKKSGILGEKDFDDCSGVKFEQSFVGNSTIIPPKESTALVQSLSHFFDNVGGTMKRVSTNLTEVRQTSNSSFTKFLSERVFRK